MRARTKIIHLHGERCFATVGVNDLVRNKPETVVRSVNPVLATIFIKPAALEELSKRSTPFGTIDFGRTKWGDARASFAGVNFILDDSLPKETPWRVASQEEKAAMNARRQDGTVVGYYADSPAFYQDVSMTAGKAA